MKTLSWRSFSCAHLAVHVLVFSGAFPNNLRGATGPDLAVVSLKGPSIVASGTYFLITNTIFNLGSSPAGPVFSIRYLLSPAPDSTANSKTVANFPYTFTIPGNSGWQPVFEIAIPPDMPAGDYYWSIILNESELIPDSNTNNNSGIGNAVHISVGPQLNLSILAPALTGQGELITLTNSVSNIGSGNPGQFSVGFYLSSDPNITTNDFKLGSRVINGLQPGQASPASTVFQLPLSLNPGNYYVGAIVEAPVPASAVGNIMQVLAGFDLGVASVQGPGSGSRGGLLAESALIQNLTARNVTNSFYVAFYLSTDSIITTNDLLLGLGLVNGLGAGQSILVAPGSLLVPVSLAPGTYFAGAIADGNGAVHEMDKSNNAATGQMVSIGGGPDLTMTSLAGPAVSGLQGSINVTNTIANVGDGFVIDIPISFYLSVDPIVDTSDLLLGSRLVPGLAPGGNNTDVTSLFLDANIPPGTYFLGAIADPLNQFSEPVESNNVTVGNMIVVTQTNLVGMTVAGPSRSGPLGLIQITNSIQSQYGEGPATIGFYLSRDAVISTNDLRIGQRAIAGLAPGQISSAVTSVTLGFGVSGMYFLGAMVDGLPGSAATGNTLEIVGLDLVTTAAGPTVLATGALVPISDVEQNVGVGDITHSFLVGYYLSTDASITTNDILIGSRFVPAGLAHGQSNSGTANVLIPMELAPGAYYLGAIADRQNAIVEADESNNAFLVGPVTVVVGPDLVEAELIAPPSFATGVPFNVSDTVINAGIGGAFSFNVGFYISTSPVITTNDLRLGQRTVDYVPAGQSSSATTPLVIPSSFAGGTYYLSAIADNYSGVPESNENNNSALSGPLQVTVGADLTVLGVSGPSVGTVAENIVVTNTVRNIGAGSAVTFSVDLYLSADALITTNDIKIGTRLVSAALGPAQNNSVASVIGLSPGLAPGDYYLGAIVNGSGAVMETDSANNAMAGGIIHILSRPDIIMTAVSSPGTVLVGQSFSITNTVVNVGGQDASKPFRIGFYLSESPVITLNDLWIGTRILTNGLGQGQSSTANSPITIQTDVVPGTYYLGAIADETFGISETDETNNILLGNVIRVVVSEMVDARVSGPNVLIRFTTAPQQNYRLERTATLGDPASWQPVTGAESVAGTGSIVTVTDVGVANLPTRFYRVKLLY